MGLYPELETNTYVGSFHFRVSIPNMESINQAFTGVSGVVSESEKMEFMHGTDPYVRKGAGRTTYEDVVLQRIYNGSDQFYEWRIQVEAGIVERRDIKIELLRPDGSVARTMMCRGAWPSKWELPPMDASGSSAAVESISLTVERVTNE